VWSVKSDMAEATGDRSRDSTHWPGAIVVATAPPRQPAGKSGREPRPRRHKLAPDAEAAIRADAGASLRELASAYGVSYETVRTIRRGLPALAAD